jgi:hypothetical protein
MPKTFTSHELILRLAQKHQHAYINALHSCLDSDTPFQRVHQWISNSLNKYPSQLVNAGVKSSHDIFGNPNACSSWEKTA